MTRYLIFGISCLSLLIVSISGTTVTVAFPVIATEFNSSLILTGWVLTVNLLMSTICMPLGGKAGEVFGVKRVYLFSLAAFTIGSLICALAPNIPVLILGRFCQSIASGMIYPLGIAIISKTFPESRQRTIGFFTSIYPLGNLFGPTIGGWIIGTFGWSWIFWYNIPLGLIVFLISLKLLKDEKGEGGQLDLLGISYFTGAISAFIVALTVLGDAQNGSSWLIPGTLFVAAIVLLLAFFRRERNINNPVIELRFLIQKPFLQANTFFVSFGASFVVVVALLPLFATSVYGMTTLESGLIMTPRAIGQILAMTLTSYYLPKWGYRKPLLVSISILMISLILLGLEPSGFDILGIHLNATFLLVLFLFLAGFGTGITYPAANNAYIDLSPERAGMISGVMGMFNQSGGAIGIAVATMVLNSFSDIGRGFTVVYWVLAMILTMITIPMIFFLPKLPRDSRLAKIH